jgi:hypothetical protein
MEVGMAILGSVLRYCRPSNLTALGGRRLFVRSRQQRGLGGLYRYFDQSPMERQQLVSAMTNRLEAGARSELPVT